MRNIIWIVVALLSAACTTLTSLQPAQNNSLSWSTRNRQLKAMSSWTIHGVTGIRTREKAWTASLFWQQDKTAYSLNLFGPLGINRIQLVGSPTQVQLLTSEKSAHLAKDPEVLLQREVGWKLPVNNLPYWIRGIPVPGKPFTSKRDNYNHLLSLTQDNWQISYLAYGSVAGIDLPTKITIKNQTLSLRIIIKQWEL